LNPETNNSAGKSPYQVIGNEDVRCSGEVGRGTTFRRTVIHKFNCLFLPCIDPVLGDHCLRHSHHPCANTILRATRRGSHVSCFPFLSPFPFTSLLFTFHPPLAHWALYIPSLEHLPPIPQRLPEKIGHLLYPPVLTRCYISAVTSSTRFHHASVLIDCRFNHAPLMAYKHPGRIFDHGPQDSESGSDTDSISLTSTVASEEDPDDTYIVENILGEKWIESEGKMRYLVKWEGYPISRASWEPLEMFDDQDTIKEWKASQEAIKARGELPHFDWQKWDRERLAETEAQEDRKRRRSKKRQKLERQRRVPSGRVRRARQPRPGDNYNPDNDEISDEVTDSDAPLVSRRGRRPVLMGGEDEEDSASDDSLVLGSKNPNRQLARLKRLRESGGKSDPEGVNQKVQ